jgi:hypothetical protein
MKSILVSLLLLVMFGCGKSSTPTHSDAKPHTESNYSDTSDKGNPTVLTDKQKIDLLRKEAHKRHLRWRIYCNDWERNPNWQFQGEAIQAGSKFGVYIEDGQIKPWWAEDGPTQAETAFSLYLSIQQAPNMEVKHDPNIALGAHGHNKICPPELRGE